MNLKDYIEHIKNDAGPKRQDQTLAVQSFASACGISYDYLRTLVRNPELASAALCLRIAAASDNQVTPADMRGDYFGTPHR